MKIVVTLSFFLLVLLLFPYLYLVREIECISQYGECSQSIVLDLQNLEGNSIKLTDSLITNYLSGNSKIKQFNISYQPLNRYYVEVIEEKLVAAIKEYESDVFILVSEEGEKIETASGSALPKIFILRPEIKYSDPEPVFATSLLVNLARYYNINELKLDESSIVADYMSSLNLVFPVSGDVDVLLGSLELLLFQLNTKLPDTKITSIDLRYKNVVVK